MSPTNSFVAGLLSLASLRPRQSPEFPEYLTVVTEPSAVCRMYADMLGDVSFTFYDSPSVNITCWTQSSMLDDEKGRYDGSSWIWAWVQLDPEEYPDPQTEIGVGNAEQGGVAGGYGCWTHEDDMQVGDLYLPDEIQECGDAPHHQVGFPAGFNDDFVCRNCTDLDDAACQTTYPTGFHGYTSTGCWKHGTEVDGNSTWVALIEPPLENCYISPDQFHPTEWHGPPAGECQD